MRSPGDGVRRYDLLTQEAATVGAGLAGSRPGSASTIGREAEIGRITQAIDVSQGLSEALLVLGEAGTGKTLLLQIAEAKARQGGMQVLSARGWEPEARQPFASLHQLLLPVLGELEALPEHQRQALRTLFGSAPDAGPVDAMVVRLAVLALVEQLAEAGPVLLAVDDIQDCDTGSMDVLFFVTRRLTNQAVTVLFTARGETPPAGVPDDLEALPLGPLSPHAAARLLDAQSGAPTGRARLELLQQAGGNPLAIIELCRAAGGNGRVGSGAGLWQTARIQRMFDARLAALPEATRRALLYAATAPQHEELAVVMAALGTDDVQVWAPAEHAGLITVGRGRLAFRNPLVRTATLHSHPVLVRQQAHRDLAAANNPKPWQQAWHLAAASIAPDESVAAALEAATGLAGQERTCFDAATALEEAARLTPLDRDRARRLAGALTAASGAGDPGWVRDLYEKFAQVNQDPELQCAAVCAMSGALSQLSFQREAFDLLRTVWQRTPPQSAATASAMAAVATGIACQSGLPEHRRQLPGMLDHAVRVARQETNRRPQEDWSIASLAGHDVRVSLEALVSAGIDPVSGAAEALRRRDLPRLGSPGSAAGPIPMITTGLIAYYADESDLCAEQSRQAGEPLRSRGAVGLRAWTLTAEVDNLLNIGRWAEAEALIEEGSAYAGVHQLTCLGIDLEALAVTLRGLRGKSSADTRFPGPSRAAVNLDENRATQVRILRACGVTAMALEDAESAFRHFRALFADDGSPLDPFLSPRCIAQLAYAAQRVGRQQEAARILEAVRGAQGSRPTTRMTLLMHHAAALVDEDADPEHHFRLCLANPETDKWPLEGAQARLHYAIWLRRRRRTLEARAHLTAVLETAAWLGARPLGATALGELRAAGVVSSASVSAEPLAGLTSQQQQVVRLAANGLSNREIGEQLFLSPRTVGSHLYNAYPKLGITSRHQLRDVLNAG